MNGVLSWCAAHLWTLMPSALTFACFPTRESMDGFRRDFISVFERHRDGTKLLPRWLAAPAIRLRRGEDDMFFRG